MKVLDIISFNDFKKLDIRVGTVVNVKDFPEAQRPAYKLTIDLGTLGIMYSSAQITTQYAKEDLLNKQVLTLINLPKKQIANFMSDCLVIGAVAGKDVMLLAPEYAVKNGTRIF